MTNEKRSYKTKPMLSAGLLVAAILVVVYAQTSLGQPVPAQTIPSGTIVAWLGNGLPPNGWCLLDGSNNACGPDLSELYLMGTKPGERTGLGGVPKNTRQKTNLNGAHLPLLYQDTVTGGPAQGDRGPDGTTNNVFYPEHAKVHSGNLFRHRPVDAHRHRVTDKAPHYKVRFIKKT